MTDKQINMAYREAANYADADEYISDMLLSSAFLPAGEDAEPDLSLAPALQTLWRVANAPLRDIIKEAMGLTLAKAAVRWCIPRHSLQNWCDGRSAPPPYLRLLLAEAAGLLDGVRVT